MSKRKYLMIFTALLLTTEVISGCSNGQTEDIKEQKEFIPQPLIIEETDSIEADIYDGEIIINGEGILETGYEGAMFFHIHNGKATVVADDYIRNEYEKIRKGGNKEND